MILIENILADETLLSRRFLCDSSQCKGACCTYKGGTGAPLLDSEVQFVEQVVPAVLEYLPARAIKEIEKFGAVEGFDGNYGTRCIDSADCVFVYFEGDEAKCAIEKAYFAGKTEFRKPISCHLFPIRVSDFGGDYLYYEQFDECQSAIANGEKQNVFLHQMLKDALVRAYGEKWYLQLCEKAEAMNVKYSPTASRFTADELQKLKEI